MQSAAENRRGHGAADHRRGDVVEKARQHENNQQQVKPAFPVVRQEIRQQVGRAAVVEVLRKQCKPDQQTEQVAKDHPFVAKMRYQPHDSRPGIETRERKLVNSDRDKPGQGNLEGVPVEQGHAGQREREQYEIERDVRDRHGDPNPQTLLLCVRSAASASAG